MNAELKRSKKKKHTPSEYRALIRELKAGSGKEPEELVSDAKKLEDPYYISLALFELSRSPGLTLNNSLKIAKKALTYAKTEKRAWRKAELLIKIVKKMEAWSENFISQKYHPGKVTALRDSILNYIAEIILEMDPGQGLSDAIIGCSPYLGSRRLSSLLERSVTNKGFIADCVKTILRQLIQKPLGKDKGSELDIKRILMSLTKIEDKMTRSKLLGYLHLQLQKSKSALDLKPIFKMAVETAADVENEKRLEVFRYLTTIAIDEDELNLLHDSLGVLPSPEGKARLLATLGGCADKAGLSELALNYLEEGMEYSERIDNPERQASIQTNLAEGFDRLDDRTSEDEKIDPSSESCSEEVNTTSKTLETKPHEDKLHEQVSNRLEKQPPIQAKAGEPAELRRHVLAIYDTYEGGLKPIHFRTVARAAPLCYAFDLDLALMGFPSTDLGKLVEQIATETEIGKGGYYLRKLAQENRLQLISCTQNKPPDDLDKLGLPIATTSEPDSDKKISFEEVLVIAKSEQTEKRLVIIMGLGKHGLPKSLLNSTQDHLELTGNNIPLETCTAMGVIAQMLNDTK